MMQVQDPRHLCHNKLIHVSAVALLSALTNFLTGTCHTAYQWEREKWPNK